MSNPHGSGRGMTRLLRWFGATSATAGAVVLVTGIFEHAGAHGMAGLPGVGVGVVLLVASLAAFAPIPSARAVAAERTHEP